MVNDKWLMVNDGGRRPEARHNTSFVQNILSEYRHVERSDNGVETSPTDNAVISSVRIHSLLRRLGMSRQARHDGTPLERSLVTTILITKL